MKKAARRIYISGQMTGIKDFNYPKFDEVENELLNQGHIVINPANIARGIKFNGNETEEEKYKKYMEEDLHALKRCNTIYLLSGWEKSKGANMELVLAKELGLEVIHES